MSSALQLDGESLENRVVIARKELERMRKVQESSLSKSGTKSDNGIGILLDYYIRIKGHSRADYLTNHSEYVERERLKSSTVSTWFKGDSSFYLKHMKGLVDELGVSEEHLHYVAGMDPFEITEDDLEEWGGEKDGIKRLFKFYISLNHGTAIGKYFINDSEYAKEIGVSIDAFRSWYNGKNSFPPQYLKAFADEIGVPLDYVKRVSGIDLGEVKELNWDEKLEEMRKAQENSFSKHKTKTDKGIGMLLVAYIESKGFSRERYLQDESDCVEDIKLSVGTIRNYFSGNSPFPLKLINDFVDELEVDHEELKFVAGRNPFEPTEEELEEWSEDDVGVRKLLTFYVDLRYGVPVRSYTHKESEYVKKEGLNFNTVAQWFKGAGHFPLKHLEGFVGELKVPQIELEQVCGRDPFKPTDEELERWSGDKKKGVGNLLKFYVALRYGGKIVSYFRDHSEYRKENDFNLRTVIGWLNEKSIPTNHLKGFADELGIPPEYVKRVSGIDIDEVRELTRAERLEEMRIAQKESKYSKGVGMLLELHIKEKGLTTQRYFESHSPYFRDAEMKYSTIYDCVSANRRFWLKHMKELVDELEVDQDELEFVVGRNPFEPTEEELERWSQIKDGMAKLFDFYIDLNYAILTMTYLKRSRYVEGINLKAESIRSGLYKRGRVAPQHIKGLAEEIGVPPEQVKRVTGIDIGEVKTTAEELDAAIAEFLDE